MISRTNSRTRTPSAQRETGFTLIEILVAVMLLGLLVITVLAPMTGLFGLSRTTNQQLSSVTQAQDRMEQAKGLWRTQSLYDRDCMKGLNTTGITIKVQNLSSTFQPTGTEFDPSTSSTCDTTTLSSSFTPVPAKRIRVASGSGNSATTLILDLARP